MKKFLFQLLVYRTSSVKIQFLRSFIAGGIATVLDLGVLYGLTEYAGMYYLVSAIFGFALGVSVLYYLNIHWIFDKRKYTSVSKEFTVFLGISLAGLVLNELILYTGVEYLKIWYILAKIISALLVLGVNFFLRKKFLFS